jgi:regulator of protease activity HflC (stomatin/prohibitin superfamily)
MLTVRLSAVLGVPPPKVRGVVYRLKMRRVDAVQNTTQMVELKPNGNLAYHQPVDDAVRSAIRGAAPHVSVAELVTSSDPKPATVFGWRDLLANPLRKLPDRLGGERGAEGLGLLVVHDVTAAS